MTIKVWLGIITVLLALIAGITVYHLIPQGKSCPAATLTEPC